MSEVLWKDEELELRATRTSGVFFLVDTTYEDDDDRQPRIYLSIRDLRDIAAAIEKHVYAEVAR